VGFVEELNVEMVVEEDCRVAEDAKSLEDVAIANVLVKQLNIEQHQDQIEEVGSKQDWRCLFRKEKTHMNTAHFIVHVDGRGACGAGAEVAP
jgi:hypothetical protein